VPLPDLVMLLYQIADVLVDGYFPVLGRLDDQIDELEDAILQRPATSARRVDMPRPSPRVAAALMSRAAPQRSKTSPKEVLIAAPFPVCHAVARRAAARRAGRLAGCGARTPAE